MLQPKGYKKYLPGNQLSTRQEQEKKRTILLETSIPSLTKAKSIHHTTE